MRRQYVALVLALGLGLLGSFGAAWAAPDWNASAGQTFPFQVTPTIGGGTWSFAVSILPQAPTGYAIKGFFVYPETPTPVTPVSAYKDWNFGQPGTNEVFGWSGSGPPSYLQKGETATFVVEALGPLPTRFAAHIVPPATQGSTYFARPGNGGPPEAVPEPATLLLLTLGAGSVLGLSRRRKA